MEFFFKKVKFPSLYIHYIYVCLYKTKRSVKVLEVLWSPKLEVGEADQSLGDSSGYKMTKWHITLPQLSCFMLLKIK